MTGPDDGTRTMREWILGWPTQLADALGASATLPWPPRAAPAPAAAEPARSVLICGMGGSAMAGDVARSILRDRLPIPVEVVRDPAIPAWAGAGSLVLAVSYSGNTWETLRAAESARQRGARVLAICSGGALAEEAAESGWPLFRLPAGFSPRAALGWMAVAATLGALWEQADPRAEADVRAELRAAAALLAEETAIWRTGGALPGRDPVEIAAMIEGRFAFIYAPSERLWPAAARWRGQLQENAKQAATAAAFPELAHNEITGWRFAVDALPSVHLLLDDEEPDGGVRQAHLRAATRELVASGARVVRIPSRREAVSAVVSGPPSANGRSGCGTVAGLFNHILLADAVSVEVARRRGVDPLPVEAIERVKRAAAE